MVLLLGGVWGAAPSDARESVDDISRWITQLGDPSYAVRRHAEEQLVRLGPAAFDKLEEAEHHVDLEISERARHIRHRLRVQWTRADDSPTVRQLLSRYETLSPADRQRRIDQLAELSAAEGFAVLCRIARFESSPVLARHAALAVLTPADLATNAAAGAGAETLADLHSGPHADPAPAPWAVGGSVRKLMSMELGESDRLPVRWIRTALTEARRPEVAVRDWQELVAEEIDLLQQDSEQTDAAITQQLIRRQLRHVAQRGVVAEALAAIEQWIAMGEAEPSGQQVRGGLERALEWIIEYQQWETLTALEDRYQQAIAGTRFLAYLTARAYRVRGDQARARELAQGALKREAEDDPERMLIGYKLARLGEVDWAIEEYHRVLEIFPVVSAPSMAARSELAMWLHDRQQYQQAAEVMGELCDALESDERLKKTLADELDESDGTDLDGSERTFRQFYARRELYRAAWYKEQQLPDKQLESLLAGVRAFEQDADVLIELYHCPAATEPIKRQTITRIHKISRVWAELIEDYPELPIYYNQWAWLIANTEGDYQRALKFSQRSLELQPDEPSYLDTLGRCYYAVGDLPNAIKYQRRAVALQPQVQVMQRQLAFFEAEAAKPKTP
jgi:tetratricopeptide (TPR) repeat protein